MGLSGLLSRTAPQSKSNDSDVHIIDAGRLSDIVWPGKVSADGMIARSMTSAATIQEAVTRINEFYVQVNPGAKTRCIDGRHDPKLDERALGPQVPGGAPGAALAYRLGVDKDELTRGTFLVDAEDMIRRFMRLGFAPGGHRDENSDGKSAVGCGAIDGLNKILETMIEPTLIDDHKRMVKALLGGDFDRDTYLRVMGAAVVVNGRSEDYFRNRELILDVLERRSKNSVATLKGEHQECIVAVNFVPGTTLSSNRFAEAFGGMQAFGYDIWHSVQMAGKLLPRPDQAIDRQRFVMARVMSTVATLMALTDGSQHLVMRMQDDSKPQK